MQETTESPVQAQHLNSVMLKPDCIQEVCIPIYLPMYTIINMYCNSLFEIHKIMETELTMSSYTDEAKGTDMLSCGFFLGISAYCYSQELLFRVCAALTVFICVDDHHGDAVICTADYHQ
jgi:hypothetical protein